MSESEKQSTESSTSSEEPTSKEELAEKLAEANQTIDEQNQALEVLSQLSNMKENGYFRLNLVQAVQSLAGQLERQNLELNSMAKKISNQNKILAAHLGVEIE